VPDRLRLVTASALSAPALDKSHARGSMGLEELTSYKFVVVGNGQLRE